MPFTLFRRDGSTAWQVRFSAGGVQIRRSLGTTDRVAAERLRDGIYVLRIEGALVVKRLALNPAARTLSIRSDNPAYPGWPDCDPDAVDVVGRVVWAGRRIG